MAAELGDLGGCSYCEVNEVDEGKLSEVKGKPGRGSACEEQEEEY